MKKERWTSKLSNDNHQIIVAVENELVTRHIYNQPTTAQTKKDASIIVGAPKMMEYILTIYNNLQGASLAQLEQSILDAKNCVDLIKDLGEFK